VNGDEIAAQVAARVQEETGAGPLAEKDLLKWAEWCETGAALAYASIARNVVMLPAGSPDPWLFTGHYWELDRTGCHRTQLLNQVADAYIRQYFEKLKAGADKRTIRTLKRIRDLLLSSSGQRRVLELAFKGIPDALTIDPNRLNHLRGVIAFKNGVVDLATGELRPGKPTDYITKYIPHEYPGHNATPVLWENTLLDIFNNDLETLIFLQTFLGYALTGTCREHKFLIMTGPGGNGKGTILNTLQYVLAELYCAIPPETLMEQPFGKSASAPTPHLIALNGARLAVAPEVPARKLDAAQVKHLASTDPITARGPFDKVFITWLPTHTLVWACNELPKPPNSVDRGFWRRALVLRFPNLYVDEPAAANERQIDYTLGDRLKTEAPEIAAWLVAGAVRYHREGLKIPESIRTAVDAYRREHDFIGRFVEEACTTGPAEMCRAKAMYNGFRTWYANEINADRGCPSVKTFTDQLGARFDRVHRADANYWIGVDLLPEYSPQ
jgi:putative DNA primase/helicase